MYVLAMSLSYALLKGLFWVTFDFQRIDVFRRTTDAKNVLLVTLVQWFPKNG